LEVAVVVAVDASLAKPHVSLVNLVSLASLVKLARPNVVAAAADVN
jgi:hypothetical protein